MTHTEATLVAIVDDDEEMRCALEELMAVVGLTARTFASAEAFLESGDRLRTGCLIADIRMPGMSGLDLQAALNAADCRIPTIFVTAHADEHIRLRALRGGALDLLAKPFDDVALVASVRAALEE